MAGMLEAVKAVLAGIIGVRRKSDHETASLNPVHVIIAGVVLAVLFVLTLISIVRSVVG